MTFLLCFVFLLSGAAGLLFETLWFRLLGLTLGNGFVASSLVLASFMGGLAAGSALAARMGTRLRRPLRLYVLIETVVGLFGLAVVWGLPALNAPLGRLFSALGEGTELVNVLRLLTAGLVLLVPTTGMGLTLPLLSQAAHQKDPRFGRVLGRLYGFNTLGGVLGAVAGELWLVERLGQRGTGCVAAMLELVAAGLVFFFLARDEDALAPSVTAPAAAIPASPRSTLRSARWLLAAFVAGAALLALEGLWFRFLQLFVFGTHLMFAAMLAVVLFGIALGGVLASAWLGRFPAAHRFAPWVALAAGVSIPLSYVSFDPLIGGSAFTPAHTFLAVGLFLRLMLPTALLSGVLFTLLGAERGEREGAATAVGKVTLANTLGGMAGALAAGFWLLPRFGVETSLFLATLSYGAMALLTLSPSGKRIRRAAFAAAVVVPVVGMGLLFPFGVFEKRIVPLVLARYREGNPELVALREGRTETVMYLRESLRDEPVSHRLMTNGHSMSATTFRGRRYMKLYVYWAMAVAPRAQKALLISYGVGTTAKALTDTRQLTSIDVVDISRDILALSGVPFPRQTSPLDDPRVRVHVEDGRFFLQTTDQTFDLITAEPPPLRGTGVTNLYSREYFALARNRLNAGGVITYWLPVNQLTADETKSIMRAFCEVFDDCSLWNGAGLQWMLTGSRGLQAPVSEEQFTAQWRDPGVAPELASLGFEGPEALGATFLADAATLQSWSAGAAPLDDDHPGRIGARYPADEHGDPLYRAWMEGGGPKKRFEDSAFIRRTWPQSLRERTLGAFRLQAVLDEFCAYGNADRLATLYDVLDTSSSKTVPLLFMGTEPARQAVALAIYERGERGSDLEIEVGAHEIAERRYAEALPHLKAVIAGRAVSAGLLRILALMKLGRLDEARQAARILDYRAASSAEFRSLAWLRRSLEP